MSNLSSHSLETLRAMLGGLDYSSAEIYCVEKKTLYISAEKKAISQLDTLDEVHISLRLLKEGRVGAAFSSKADKESLRELLLRCQEDLRFNTAKKGNASAESWGPLLFEGDSALGDLADKTFATVATDEKMNRTLNLESNLLKVDARVKKSGGVSYKDVLQDEVLWTSGSKKALNISRSSCTLRATAIAEDGDRIQSATEEVVETQYLNLDWSAVARGAANLAAKLLGGRNVQAGRYAVCFSNLVSPYFLNLLGPAFCADRVAAGQSFLSTSGVEGWSQSQGKTLFSDQVSILDDSGQRKRWGYSPWDADGSPPERLVLVNKGKVHSLAHNRRTAQLFKTRTTGNAKRFTPDLAPVVGFHNLLLEPSNKDFIDLLRTMNKGLVLYRVHSFSPVDSLSGEIAFKADGMWVENGAEVYPLNSLVLKLKVRDIFSKVVAVGRDLRWEASVGAPSILCEGISVAG